MNKYKVCFWLNTKSNHQNSFLKELSLNNQIDLEVRYISKPSQNRLDIGWDNSNLEVYENYILGFDEAIDSLKDYEERIHIVLGNKITFSNELINLFIKEKLKWIHWSERYGLVLATKLKFNVFLFNILRPLYLLTKLSYGKIVNKYAIGAFSHGELAKKDFRFIGISEDKINNLFYTSIVNKSNNINCHKDNNLTTFLYVGELSSRKGIKELLIACSKLQKNKWGLILVGKDKSNGYYEKLSKELNLEKHIKFEGVVKHDKVSSYYERSDVFVFPSKFDGWGAVLNEAISFELPIISTDETSSSYTLVKDNGFVVKAGNVEKLKESMQKYIINKNLLSIHSKESKKLSNICTPKSNVERFLNALNKWTED
jgi:glycosyltransferase involved in cell wall biosynthesis